VSSASSRRGVADLYLSTEAVAMVGSQRTLWHQDVTGCEAGLAALARRWVDAGAPTRIKVWLGASLCRPVRVSRVAGSLSRRERRHLVESSAIAGSGLTAPCRLWLDQGVDAEAVTAIVVEEAVLAAIGTAFSAFSAFGARAVSIRPWWARALDAALATNPALNALGIWEGGALTVLTGSDDTFASARTQLRVGTADLAAAAFSRALVSAMIAPDDALALGLDWRASSRVEGREPLGFGDLPFLPWAVRLGEHS